MIKKRQQALNNDFIKFRKHDIEKINEQLKKDTELFRKYGLMDYSLLFAIERVEEEEEALAPLIDLVPAENLEEEMDKIRSERR
jgi:hypothetical protein